MVLLCLAAKARGDKLQHVLLFLLAKGVRHPRVHLCIHIYSFASQQLRARNLHDRLHNGVRSPMAPEERRLLVGVLQPRVNLLKMCCWERGGGGEEGM